MLQTFDHIADSYDRTFTHTSTGKYQRDLVWGFLNRNLPKTPLSVLEVNCGTGEDALFLAQKGHRVIATDISEEMVIQAHQKAMTATALVEAQVCSVQQTIQQYKNKKFDLIFSNFGGLNCVSPQDLAEWAQHVSKILNSKGRIVAVIMPKFCLWETLAYAKKLNFKEAFRRSTTKAVQAQVGELSLPIWYYSPPQIAQLFADFFDVKTVRSVGFFLPPSYLEDFFVRRPQFLNTLNQLEDKGKHFPLLARWSDHFLIELVRKV